jgi:TPR repeat protein
LKAEVAEVADLVRAGKNSAPWFREYGPGRLDVWKAASRKDSAEGHYLLGRCRQLGVGAAADDREAAACYRQAALGGLALAQYDLALRQERGDDGQPDLAQAARWHEKAAAQGWRPSQDKLGAWYQAGTGVGRDPKKAAYWQEQSAALGTAA